MKHYILRHKETGLYGTMAIPRFLYGAIPWIAGHGPTDEEVNQHLNLLSSDAILTDNKNGISCLADFQKEKFEKYLPDFEFVEVKATVKEV